MARADWLWDRETAESMRQEVAYLWVNPDARPLRRRKEPGKRLKVFEAERVLMLSAMPDWMLPILMEEERFLSQRWDWWESKP